MKTLLVIGFVLLQAAALAQEKDRYELAADSLRVRESEFSIIKNDTTKQKLDTLTQKVDKTNAAIQKMNATLTNPLGAGKKWLHSRKDRKKKNKRDSIAMEVADSRDSLRNVQGSIVNKVDSLSPDRRLSTAMAKRKGKITHKLDSVQKLSLPTDRYSRKLDSINSIDPTSKIKKGKSKIATAQSQINSKTKKPNGKINEKMNLLSKEAEGEGNLPANINLPGVDKNAADVVPDVDLDKPDLPGIEKPDLERPDLNIGELPSINAKGSLPDLKINQLKPDLDEKLDDLSAPVQGVSGVTKQIGEGSQVVADYANDAKEISSADSKKIKEAQKDLVGKVAGDESNTMLTKSSELDKQKEEIKSYRNPEEYKKQTLARAKEVIATQFAAQQKTLEETTAKVGKYQKRSGSIIAQVKDLPKRPRKSLRPPFIERFVPGLTVQVQKTEAWLLDFNPSIRYRVRSIFSLGTGWNERVALDQSGKYREEQRVYGMRSFAELTIKNGLAVRADAERMNAYVPVTVYRPDGGTRKWVWSYMAGLKKDFSFAPGVVGNVQFMYNLYDPEKESPYLKRLNVRFGFEFPLKTVENRRGLARKK